MPAHGKLRLRILTPSREVVSRDVDSVNLVAEEGEVGILPGHAALLAALRPGVGWCRDGATISRYAISDGMLEVQGDVVTVLARTAEPADEIDVARAEKRRAECEAVLKQAQVDELKQTYAEVSLQKQLARLQAARGGGGSH